MLKVEHVTYRYERRAHRYCGTPVCHWKQDR